MVKKKKRSKKVIPPQPSQLSFPHKETKHSMKDFWLILLCLGILIVLAYGMVTYWPEGPDEIESVQDILYEREEQKRIAEQPTTLQGGTTS